MCDQPDGVIYGRIYLVTNKNDGKIYVGQTIGLLAARWRGHCNSSRGGRLKKAIDDEGRDQFSIVEIDSAKSKAELDEKERFYISLYRSTDHSIGYNIERGGSGFPRSREAAARGAEKIRGIPLSDEHKKRISDAKKGKQQTQNHIQKMIAGKINGSGFKHSESAKKKMSLAAMGKKMPPVKAETREKLSARMRDVWRLRKETSRVITISG